MDKYEVLLYPRAFRDIDDSYAYIALEKLSLENAQAQIDRIWTALKKTLRKVEATAAMFLF